MNKISFKTYLNDRLKEVDFHGKPTYPLYVQVTHERKTIFFKSYYFELFSKPRYLLEVPGVGSRGPDLQDVIEKENEVIRFIIDKHINDFSLELFKTAYAYYSKDLCDVTERGFVTYLYTFFWDKGMPHLGDMVKYGSRNVVAYDLIRDFKRSFTKELYNELMENAFYYGPPYLPLYGYMSEIKRWPMLCLTVMEFDNLETIFDFDKYVKRVYPFADSMEVIRQVQKWPNYQW